MISPKRNLYALGISMLIVATACESAAPLNESGNGQFAGFVDEYLVDFARRHPSIAAGNGIPDFDGTLDAFSAKPKACP